MTPGRWSIDRIVAGMVELKAAWQSWFHADCIEARHAAASDVSLGAADISVMVAARSLAEMG